MAGLSSFRRNYRTGCCVAVATEMATRGQRGARGDPQPFCSSTPRDACGNTDYGVDDPHALVESRREALFRRHLAGDDDGEPDGALNRANALFISNAINGLDDLIFIVMFGAKPYVVPPTGRRPAGSHARRALLADRQQRDPCLPAR